MGTIRLRVCDRSSPLRRDISPLVRSGKGHFTSCEPSRSATSPCRSWAVPGAETTSQRGERRWKGFAVDKNGERFTPLRYAKQILAPCQTRHLHFGTYVLRSLVLVTTCKKSNRLLSVCISHKWFFGMLESTEQGKCGCGSQWQVV